MTRCLFYEWLGPFAWSLKLWRGRGCKSCLTVPSFRSFTGQKACFLPLSGTVSRAWPPPSRLGISSGAQKRFKHLQMYPACPETQLPTKNHRLELTEHTGKSLLHEWCGIWTLNDVVSSFSNSKQPCQRTHPVVVCFWRVNLLVSSRENMQRETPKPG